MNRTILGAVVSVLATLAGAGIVALVGYAFEATAREARQEERLKSLEDKTRYFHGDSGPR